MSSSRRGRERGGGSSRSARAAAPPAAVTPEGLLAEAETLQQRAERRSGSTEALRAFEAAADKYREALAAGLDPENAANASFGLGECLQLWADLRLQLMRQAPDEQLVLETQQAPAAAAGLYQASVQAYQQVRMAPGGQAEGPLRPDAAANAATALASWAELAAGEERQRLLAQAVGLYREALLQEEDAPTLSNLGDSLIAQGEAALGLGQAEAGQQAFSAALAAYEQSCALSDSSAGDDLPGLLHNWGVGLHTCSKYAQEPQLRHSLLEQAAGKLRGSIQFSRADPAPLNALGDVLMDAADLAAGGGGTGAPSALPPAAAEAAAALVKQAADDGYMQALTIQRTNADALVGLAEVATALAALARRQGDQAAAGVHAAAALAHYVSALQRPHLLGDAAERADVRYNAACAAARAGDTAAAQRLLTALAASGALQADEAAADEDLSPLRSEPWFGELLARLAAS